MENIVWSPRASPKGKALGTPQTVTIWVKFKKIPFLKKKKLKSEGTSQKKKMKISEATALSTLQTVRIWVKQIFVSPDIFFVEWILVSKPCCVMILTHLFFIQVTLTARLHQLFKMQIISFIFKNLNNPDPQNICPLPKPLLICVWQEVNFIKEIPPALKNVVTQIIWALWNWPTLHWCSSL